MADFGLRLNTHAFSVGKISKGDSPLVKEIPQRESLLPPKHGFMCPIKFGPWGKISSMYIRVAPLDVTVEVQLVCLHLSIFHWLILMGVAGDPEA